MLKENNKEKQVPRVGDLGSEKLVSGLTDNFNPPGLTNFYASLQAERDITGIRSFTSPPLSTGEVGTCYLYVDGEYLASAEKEVEYRWRPDRISRKVEFDGLDFHSKTYLPPEKKAAVVELEVKNLTKTEKSVSLLFRLNGGVTKKEEAWDDAVPPSGNRNEVQINREENLLAFKSESGDAYSLQGVSPSPDVIDKESMEFSISVRPGGSVTILFFDVMGESKSEALEDYRELTFRSEDLARNSEEFWNRELSAVFEPESDRYPGHLPVLKTDNEDLRRLYYTGIVGTIYHKRLWSEERTYVTLMPRYWQTPTFLWDISLSSSLFSLLDPEFLKRYIEKCLRMDIHSHHSVENLTGDGAGPWYSVNDFALLKMIRAYIKYNEDDGWLEKEIRGKEIVEHMIELATHWEELDVNDHGLADYGEVGNLLECVYSYTHEVASLNAANVFNLRFVADILEEKGRTNEARLLRGEADSLLERVKSLYVSGGGYWRCKQPDGEEREVRHCYDFMTVLETIPEDLGEDHREEMARFFEEELHAPRWLHALSRKDRDAVSSMRPDHQWLGAYTAWPALTLEGIIELGMTEVAKNWIKGLGKTALQGPFGQAHVVREAMDPMAGGARKSPSTPPYICDWACVANGSYFDAIVESVFGMEASVFGGITAEPKSEILGEGSELEDLRYRGELLSVDDSGLVNLESESQEG